MVKITQNTVTVFLKCAAPENTLTSPPMVRCLLQITHPLETHVCRILSLKGLAFDISIPVTFSWVGNGIFWNCTLKHNTLKKQLYFFYFDNSSITAVKPNKTNYTFCFCKPKNYGKHKTIIILN